jgi:hypothetical protein
MEEGSLKIRVRSLENEFALQRLSTQSKATTSLLLATVLLNFASSLKATRAPAAALTFAAVGLALRGVAALGSLAAFDKKQAKYVSKDFN